MGSHCPVHLTGSIVEGCTLCILDSLVGLTDFRQSSGFLVNAVKHTISADTVYFALPVAGNCHKLLLQVCNLRRETCHRVKCSEVVIVLHRVNPEATEDLVCCRIVSQVRSNTAISGNLLFAHQLPVFLHIKDTESHSPVCFVGSIIHEIIMTVNINATAIRLDLVVKFHLAESACVVGRQAIHSVRSIVAHVLP